MPITLNDGLGIEAPRPADDRYGTYTSVADANLNISEARRFIGLTVGIVEDSVLSEFWYKNGITDSDLIAKEIAVTKESIGLGNVDNTSDLDKPVSSATQSALDEKEGLINAGTVSQYWRGDKTWQTLDKSAVGLSNVDNTSDLDKPVSAATQAALDLKLDSSLKGAINGVAELDVAGKVPVAQLPSLLELGETSSTAHRGDHGKTAYDHSQLTSGNPHNVTKSDVGLGSVNNTSDLDKPISTATQTALDGKENVFSKNTAFNKNFGNASGTVCQGNDARLGTKNIDESNIGNAKVLSYNAANDNIEYVPNTGSGIVLPRGSIISSYADEINGTLLMDGVSLYSKTVYSALWNILCPTYVVVTFYFSGINLVANVGTNSLQRGTPVFFTAAAGGVLPSSLTAYQTYYLLERTTTGFYIMPNVQSASIGLPQYIGSGTVGSGTIRMWIQRGVGESVSSSNFKLIGGYVIGVAGATGRTAFMSSNNRLYGENAHYQTELELATHYHNLICGQAWAQGSSPFRPAYRDTYSNRTFNTEVAGTGNAMNVTQPTAFMNHHIIY